MINKELQKRIFSSMILLPVSFFFIIQGSLTFIFFLSLIFLITSLEWFKMTKNKDLVRIFGKPQDSSNQYEYFFTAANFLQYANNLRVVRTEGGVLNADSDGVGILIKDDVDYQSNYQQDLRNATTNAGAGAFTARTAGNCSVMSHGGSGAIDVANNDLLIFGDLS